MARPTRLRSPRPARRARRAPGAGGRLPPCGGATTDPFTPDAPRPSADIDLSCAGPAGRDEMLAGGPTVERPTGGVARHRGLRHLRRAGRPWRQDAHPPVTGRSGAQVTPRPTASTRTALHRCRLSAGHRRCGRWRWGRCECWRPGSRGRGDNVRRLRESRQDVRFSAVCVHCLYRGHLWRAEPASRGGGRLAVGVWSGCYGLPPARLRASPTREGAGGKAISRPEGGGSAWASTSTWRAGRGDPDRRTGGDAT